VNCQLCQARITYRGNWPACGCDTDPDLMLTVRQAAHFLSMSRGGVYHLIYVGDLPADRSRRPMRVAMLTLKAYLAAEHAEWASRQEANQAGRL
jgi:excisionase family DNA binding protein